MADEPISSTTATTAATTDATLLSAPPATAATTAATTAAITPDPTKNADGTAKTPEQIAADKKIADAAKPVGAPETYAEFKAPEGVTLDKEGVTELSTFAKEHNLSQDDAQKLVDLAIKNAGSAQAAQAKAWNDTRATWRGEIEKDPEIGGANFAASKEYAIKAVNQFGSPELGKVWATGWGDNPALFKFCVNIGKRLSEDKVVDGSTASNDPKSVANLLYGGAKK